MIAIIPESVIGIPGTLIGIVRNPQDSETAILFFKTAGFNRSPTPPLMIISHLLLSPGTKLGLPAGCNAASATEAPKNPHPVCVGLPVHA